MSFFYVLRVLQDQQKYKSWSNSNIFKEKLLFSLRIKRPRTLELNLSLINSHSFSRSCESKTANFVSKILNFDLFSTGRLAMCIEVVRHQWHFISICIAPAWHILYKKQQTDKGILFLNVALYIYKGKNRKKIPLKMGRVFRNRVKYEKTIPKSWGYFKDKILWTKNTLRYP